MTKDQSHIRVTIVENRSLYLGSNSRSRIFKLTWWEKMLRKQKRIREIECCSIWRLYLVLKKRKRIKINKECTEGWYRSFGKITHWPYIWILASFCTRWDPDSLIFGSVYSPTPFYNILLVSVCIAEKMAKTFSYEIFIITC